MSEIRRIVLFGAGKAGQQTLYSLSPGDQVVAVADNDPAKLGTFFCGHQIISAESVKALSPDMIVIASMYWKEISTQLEALGHAAETIEVAPASINSVKTASSSTAGHVFAERDAWSLIKLDNVPDVEKLAVSIIMPVFNRYQTLPRAVQSVLNQSYPDFELIIVDDGSDDMTRELLDELASKDQRISLIHQPHSGVSAARNTGLAQATGELIAYLDSDNRWNPDYLRLMLQGFRDPSWQTGYAGINMFDQVSGHYWTMLKPFDYQRLKNSNFIDLNVFMHRRRLVDELGGFDENMSRLVDWELILRFSRYHPPFVIPCMLADYFIDGTARRISDEESYIDNHEKLLQGLSTDIHRQRATGPLRIAFVQHEFPALSQTFVQNEIAGLKKLGASVSAFYVREADVTGPVPDDLDMVQFTSLEHLVHLLESRNVDLVHTHFAMPHPADHIIPACERLNLPFTIKPHAFDIFRHDHDPRHHISRSANHPLCQAIYCEGEYHQRFLEQEGVPADKLMVVRNIFDLGEFRANQPQAHEKITRIVSVSRFVEKKGYHLLIEAFRTIDNPELRLELYGYGEDEQRLRELAEGDDRIEIKPGPRNVSEAAPIMKSGDLFALPCIRDRFGDTDGQPTVLMEAMAAGVPVLTTPLASIPDLVRPNQTGYLVESGSVQSLIEGLHGVLNSSAAERERIVRGAWDRLDEEFDPVLNTKKLLHHWQSMIPDAND